MLFVFQPASIILGFMQENNEIRKGRHCVFDMHVHLVFVTKYRHPVFGKQHLKRLERIFGDVCENFDCRLEEFNGETDHVHLLVSFPPTVELSRLVNSLKGVSSRYMRRDYPELAQHYWRAQRLWSPSYYAGTAGGAPLNTLKRYIENQNRPA